MESFINIVIWAAVIQGLLLGLIFIFSKKHQSFANRLLGFFLLAFVFQSLSDVSPLDEIGNYSINGYFSLPEVKLFLPLLFLHFVLEKVGRATTYQSFLKIHYVLGFGAVGLTIINILLFLFLDSSLTDLLGWGIIEPFYMGFQYYAFALTVIAFAIAIKETWGYRNLVRNEISDITLLDINWLWQFIFIIAPIVIFWGAELLRILLGGRGQSELTTIAYIFIAIFNYFVSFKAFTQQTLFDKSTDALSTANEPVISERPGTNLESETCKKIISLMQEKRYYLNQNLTLHEFSREIQISARTISICVNQSMRLNFNEWINNYRVGRALEIMQNPKNNHLSIEGIGIDSGFKSRSAMYTAFKKKTGQTPGNFRTL
jgi:AraC-like DNA-binding protein